MREGAQQQPGMGGAVAATCNARRRPQVSGFNFGIPHGPIRVHRYASVFKIREPASGGSSTHPTGSYMYPFTVASTSLGFGTVASPVR